MASESELVTDERAFRHALERLQDADIIGLDLEANGFFRYPERVCLVQMSTQSDVYLIDPLAIDDMSMLGAVLRDPAIETVLHSGSYDVLSLDRDWGIHIRNLFDTQIAASFIGEDHLGLGAVLEAVLGVKVEKAKKLQRSDWSKRPLSKAAIDYAAGDVRHLLDLRDALVKRLTKLGRLKWVLEECERLSGGRYQAPDPEMAVFGVKGWRTLDERGLAILKALVEFRERRAVELGRPHFRVIPDSALLAVAGKPNGDLKAVRGLGRFGRGGGAAGIRRSIAEGKSTDPPRRPSQPKRERLSRAEAAKVGRRLDKLKNWRIAQGKLLSLDPALLWPMRSMQRIARSPQDLKEEMRSPGVRRWQLEEFGDAVRAVLV